MVDGLAIEAKTFLKVLVLVPVGNLVETAPDGVGQLNEAYSSLSKSPGHEALAAKIVSMFVSDSVSFSDCSGFRIEVHPIGGFGLHTKGEFKGLDEAFELSSCRSSGLVILIHGLDKLELFLLLLGSEIGVGKVVDLSFFGGNAFVANGSALVNSREKGIGVVPCSAETAWANGDKAGQGVVFGAEAVGYPRAEGGANGVDGASVEFQRCIGVVEAFGMHGPDDAEFVGVLGDFGEEFANPEPGLTPLFPFKG